MIDKFDINEFAEFEIEVRTNNAKILAKKFKEFKGLSFEELLVKIPISLDFITFCELHKALND